MQDKTWQEYLRFFPGGVHSPVRSFQEVQQMPLRFVRGKGPFIYDEQGKAYLDFVLGFGPHILGHSYPPLVKALQKRAAEGLHFGASHPLELPRAREIQKYFPSLAKMRFVNSGTEALMSAIRLARAYTGRDKILIFEGGYHGHADSFLASPGSGLLTHRLPKSEGVPEAFLQNTLVAEYNNVEHVEKLFKKWGKEIAAVVVEPVAGNMGLVRPSPDFLPVLRKITRKYESLLLFDEVITGFRACLGGAQHLFSIEPDLTCLGKIIGGGLPLALFGGKKEIMEKLSPLGPVYQAGTLSANPLCLTAALAVLQALPKYKAKYAFWEKKLALFAQEAAKKNIAVSFFGLSFSLFFCSFPPRNLKEVKASNKEKYKTLFAKALKAGLFIPPSPFETFFLSFQHKEEHLEKLASLLFSL